MKFKILVVFAVALVAACAQAAVQEHPSRAQFQGKELTDDGKYLTQLRLEFDLVGPAWHGRPVEVSPGVWGEKLPGLVLTMPMGRSESVVLKGDAPFAMTVRASRDVDDAKVLDVTLSEIDKTSKEVIETSSVYQRLKLSEGGAIRWHGGTIQLKKVEANEYKG